MSRNRPLSKRHAVIYAALTAAFLLIELPAVFDGGGDGDTFSELVAWISDLHWTVEAGLVGFWMWLGYHFFVGRRRDRGEDQEGEGQEAQA